jgi:hypothetical protein
MLSNSSVLFFQKVKKGHAGISLVETMVSGTVASILVAVVMMIFSIQSRELDMGTGNAFLHGISTIVSEQIGKDIRRANRLLVPGETWQVSGVYNAIHSQSLLIYDNAGVILKGYRINNGYLEESTNGVNWISFTIGNIQAKVDPAGYFDLSQDRKASVLVLQNILEKKSRLFTSVNKMELFRCRN